METKGEKPLRIECADGNTREVTFQPGTKLVSHSRVISESGSAGEAIEKQGLSERQSRGLGLPAGYLGILSEPEERTYGAFWPD